MSDAKKLPSGRWRNQLYVGKDENGKRIYESFTADTKKEANLMAMERARELEQGIKKERSVLELTISEAIDKYIEERCNVLSPKTIREYKAMKKLRFRSLMNIKLKNLTSSMVQQAVNAESKNLSPKTVRNAWGLVSPAIKAYAPDFNFSPKLPELIKSDFRIPTEKELIELLDHVHGKSMEIPILLGAVCGMRRGEITALNLNRDVDYENCRITVREAATQDENGVWSTKSPKEYHSHRTIDAPAWVIERLRIYRDDGKQILKANSITCGFNRLKKRFSIPVRFHDLRHYYASVMLSLGVPDKYAMQRMGHSTPDMLKKVYQHLIDETDKKMTVLINSHFDNMQHEMQHKKSDGD